jgi:tetratricopeptide (TPR) repeat protein
MPAVPFPVAQPVNFSQEDFQRALREKLTTDEVSAVVNPLAASPEMARWGEALTVGCTNDSQKARAIFAALSARSGARPARFREPPTAEGAFAAWKNPEETFQCQQLAILYVALARSVGLAAYHTFVEEDCFGTRVYHECAAVFFKSRALLVDPNYDWFGVPHRRFTILNDLESAAVFLVQKETPGAWATAGKLAPGLNCVRQARFRGLAQSNRLEDAERELQALAASDPDGPGTLYAMALKEDLQGSPEKAVPLLQQATRVAPKTEFLHRYLGNIYLRLDRWSEARLSYENARHCAVYEKDERTDEELLEFATGRQFEGTGLLKAAIASYDKAIRLNEDCAEYYVHRGLAYEAQGDPRTAIADYSRVIEMRPAWAQAYGLRAAVRRALKDWSGADRDYAKATAMEPALRERYAAEMEFVHRQAELRWARKVEGVLGTLFVCFLLAVCLRRKNAAGPSQGQ